MTKKILLCPFFLLITHALMGQSADSLKEKNKTDTSLAIAEPVKSPIRALSDEEYNAYKTGQDMGMGKTAELNNYPTPVKVLEFQKQLKLTSVQISQLKTAVEAMQFKTEEMGRFILAQEKKLNDLFAAGKADEGSIIYYSNKIGLYLGELRNAHLQAHLKARRILTPDQIKKYNRLMAYSN